MWGEDDEAFCNFLSVRFGRVKRMREVKEREAARGVFLVSEKAEEVVGKVFLEGKPVQLASRGEARGILEEAWVPMWIRVLREGKEMHALLHERQARFYRKIAIGGYVQVVINGVVSEVEKRLHMSGCRGFRDGALVYQLICPENSIADIIGLLRAEKAYRFVVIRPREILKYLTR